MSVKEGKTLPARKLSRWSPIEIARRIPPPCFACQHAPPPPLFSSDLVDSTRSPSASPPLPPTSAALLILESTTIGPYCQCRIIWSNSDQFSIFYNDSCTTLPLQLKIVNSTLVLADSNANRPIHIGIGQDSKSWCRDSYIIINILELLHFLDSDGSNFQAYLFIFLLWLLVSLILELCQSQLLESMLFTTRFVHWSGLNPNPIKHVFIFFKS